MRRGEDLQRLIDMLLQSTRVDLAGTRKEIALFKLIADAVQDFDTIRPLRVVPPPEATILVDAIAVHQILSMLLENAVAHSPADTEIEIVCSTGPSEVSISVRNHGSLPEDIDVRTLFTRFERGPQARSSGMGMGLYIASSLADSIDGRIDVTSEDGVVDFTLVFPAHLPTDQATPINC